jgi:DNA-binding MarR family transcriptional regulator
MNMHSARMKNEPSEAVVRAWARLMRAQHAALSQIQASLKAAGLPPLDWYDVLLELERAGRKGLRPFELERAMLLPQYGLSRLLDRIEAAGYIERRPCDDDGRGQIVALTTAGRERRRSMWPICASAIHKAIATRLSEEEAAALDGLLGKLIESPKE